MIAKFLTAAAVTALAASPSLAAPVGSAASLSVTKSARASTPSQKKSALEGGGVAIAVAAAAAVIAGIVIIADDDDSDSN